MFSLKKNTTIYLYVGAKFKMQRLKEIALENILKVSVEQKQGRLTLTKDLEGVLYQRTENANY